MFSKKFKEKIWSCDIEIKRLRSEMEDIWKSKKLSLLLYDKIKKTKENKIMKLLKIKKIF